MKIFLLRCLILSHRYLGIAIGWLMLVWCLSGVVMIYVNYPMLDASERHAAAAALDIVRCCKLPEDLFDATQPISGFQVEMLAGKAVLRVEPEFGSSRLIALRTGLPMEMSAEAALSVASEYVRQTSGAGLTASPSLIGLIDHDQWTVYGDEDQRPLFHLAVNDAHGTQLYVSSISGVLTQRTNRMQRFWNWLGAVPHWLYPTLLRERVELWTRIVVWSSMLGIFLAAFGVGLGIWQLRRSSDGRLHSPYRGWKYWHHVPGLVFGLAVLTWVSSGLLSMNPWGLLETQGQGRDAQQIAGALPTWATVRDLIRQLPQAHLPTNTVAIDSNNLQGKLYAVATTRSDERSRFDDHWQLAPLRESDVQDIAAALSDRKPTGLLTDRSPRMQLLAQEDDYYYGQAQQRLLLPVWRVILPDAQATRYYLDPITGSLLSKIDTNARWYRWLHSGLHRMDFNSLLRRRPLWDLLMWLLLSGAALTCGTGTWLAIKRLRGR